MLTVGFTGSIAVGKSFVCSVLRESGIPVLDADQTAREVVAAGTDGLSELVSRFGVDVLTANGELDRKKMASVVFDDPERLSLLNSIVHPRVFAKQNDWIREQDASGRHDIAVIDAALMIESGAYKRFDKIVVVWCEPDIQLRRLMLRDNLSGEEALKRVAAQMSQDDKKRYADHLINTSNGLDDTHRRTLDVIELLRYQAPQQNDA
jgi:dephospho-CoA kinase